MIPPIVIWTKIHMRKSPKVTFGECLLLRINSRPANQTHCGDECHLGLGCYIEFAVSLQLYTRDTSHDTLAKLRHSARLSHSLRVPIHVESINVCFNPITSIRSRSRDARVNKHAIYFREVGRITVCFCITTSRATTEHIKLNTIYNVCCVRGINMHLNIIITRLH